MHGVLGEANGLNSAGHQGIIQDHIQDEFIAKKIVNNVNRLTGVREQLSQSTM